MSRKETGTDPGDLIPLLAGDIPLPYSHKLPTTGPWVPARPSGGELLWSGSAVLVSSFTGGM